MSTYTLKNLECLHYRESFVEPTTATYKGKHGVVENMSIPKEKKTSTLLQ